MPSVYLCLSPHQRAHLLTYPLNLSPLACIARAPHVTLPTCPLNLFLAHSHQNRTFICKEWKYPFDAGLVRQPAFLFYKNRSAELTRQACLTGTISGQIHSSKARLLDSGLSTFTPIGLAHISANWSPPIFPDFFAKTGVQ